MGSGQSAAPAPTPVTPLPKLSDEERISIDTSDWKKYQQKAEEAAVHLKKQVDDALKQSAQIQYEDRLTLIAYALSLSNYCKPERAALLECYKQNATDPLKCWDLAQQFSTCSTKERMMKA